MSRYRRLLLIPLLGVGLMLSGVLPTVASSHREAPLISEDPVADDTDVYAFVSPDRPDTVTLIGNWIPLEEPAGGPNFYKFGQDVRYTFKIDNNGDAVPDVIYEFRFATQVLNGKTFLYNTGPITSLDDPHFNVRQTYSVARIDHGKREVLATGLSTPPDNIGPRSTPNYDALAAAAVHTLDKDGGAKVFAGQRDDPFFVDLGSVFDLAGLRPLNQAHALKLDKANGVDGVSGYNVHSIALQVPISSLTANGKAPTGPDDPNSMGVLGGDSAGFPNGRRLADDVLDVELRALAGGTPFTPDFNKAPNNVLGDGVDHNDKPFMTAFPYEATPWQGYDSPLHRVGP